MLTRIEFDEICKLVCPHCASATERRQRTDTQEIVHDILRGGVMTHTLCWASGFRRSRFAKESIDG